MREIVFDTETTGLNPLGGDRIVEIGCVEMVNRLPTGQTFHVYLNPERDMPDGAFRVHGLSAEFLADKPLFSAIAQDFIEFIGDAALVAHNASFDMGFINAELVRIKMPGIAAERVIDTLQLARRKHPFGPNSLDALCQRYNIDNSRRTKHGALLDSEILAEVYIELTGGRQADLGLAPIENASSEATKAASALTRVLKTRPKLLAARLTEVELAAHRSFVASLSGELIWKEYIRETDKT
jgi:DNA polymerase-3 subunit epsilon